MKRFYSHIIEIDSITYELDKLDLSKNQKLHLASLVDSSLHYTIIDAILSELSAEDKRAFLQHLNMEDHQKIWNFLNEKVDKVEEKIKKAAEDLKDELHEDLIKSKRSK
ncbi:MAG: hypothetical protein AAB414_01350 [Patescibacteria group bacterium]